ncbi:S46 family peptidase [Rufibacter glacialis]|uniref:Dipeptidyl-peptidase n=1 Tax=Rufibacter glacialis TaxID=1259555 RepID=A0A5M8Q9I9_9BACT|nr:S46 family peptidase [Rufibacter glacialis]KAA6431818.1 S46 family peptidase [Rufibacter glacialis]GGK81324.1 Asp/Glu-specific dipeptidyl-peptidase [Rufibacter glacialis]
MFNRKQLCLWVLLALSSFSASADEGMWLPMLLKQLNEADMQKKGMRLSAEDIYSINKSSLKDAIVQFGGGCTGEIISNQGLLLTNHHCGYGQIQSHSSVENDYLTNGFWAMTRQEEKPNPGLSATFIVRMEDVTKQILGDVPAGLPEAEREKLVQANIKKVQAQTTTGTHYEAIIRPFFYGNEYYMYVTETFKDIRLVGAPPESIGKFGGDTDNWMWPRHTGDFALFRIYAGPDNKPAAYSPDNKPYVPKHHLPISLAGIQQGDFTMVFGFPGRTTEYLPSQAVREIAEVSDPAKVKIRTVKLGILDQDMKADPKVRIQYAAKYASVSNAHKKWIGEMRGLKKLDAIAKKQALERQFSQWVAQETGRKNTYGQVLGQFEQNYAQLGQNLTLGRDYYMEAVLGVELLNYAQNFVRLADLLQTNGSAADVQALTKRLQESAPGFFKNYNLPTDKKVFAALMELYAKDLDPSLHPAAFGVVAKNHKGNWAAFADNLYANTNLVSEQKVQNLLQLDPAALKAKLTADPAIMLMFNFMAIYQSQILPKYTQLTDQNTLLNRTYLQGLREMQKDKKFYPDANSTLRVSFGQVDTYKPVDGVTYDYYTTLEGIMEKEDPSIPDYKVPAKLKELYQKKDYGPYGVNGKMPVAFIASNHTTGGNSGSPVINARGELIGTNFDRNWEGTMSDIMYDPDRVRNISMDARYFLFIVDKFAGAGHLVKEMTLVNNGPQTPAPSASKKQPELKIKKNKKNTKIKVEAE